MRVKVHLTPWGAGATKIDYTIELYLGSGEQLLRWLASAAVARFEEYTGEPIGSFNPQSILTRGGRTLDADAVVNEILNDGDECFVEYGPGPESFRARWASRPATPEFDWETGQEIVPAHDTWLQTLDLEAEGIDAICPDEVDLQGVDDLEGVDLSKRSQLEKMKEKLTIYAGMLQALWTYYFVMQSPPSKDQPAGEMTLAGFRLFIKDARLASDTLTADSLEKIFTGVVSAARGRLNERLLRAQGENVPRQAAGSIEMEGSLREFLLVILHLAYEKCLSEKGVGPKPLAAMFQHLLDQHLIRWNVDIINQQISKIRSCLNADVRSLLSKAIKMLEMLLQTAMYKRMYGKEVQIALRYLLMHMARWGLTERMSGNLMGAACVYALNTSATPEDCCFFPLTDINLLVNIDTFQRLMASSAYAVYLSENIEGPFEDFIALLFDMVFKTTGVLADAARRRDMVDDESAGLY